MSEKEVKLLLRAIMDVDMRQWGRACRTRAIQICEQVHGKSSTECFYSPTSWSYNIRNIFPENDPDEFIPLPMSAFELHDPNYELDHLQEYTMVKPVYNANGDIERYEPDTKPCAGWGLVSKNQVLADYFNIILAEDSHITAIKKCELVKDEDRLFEFMKKTRTRMEKINPNLSRKLRLVEK
jgi:hypothetical protein